METAAIPGSAFSPPTPSLNQLLDETDDATCDFSQLKDEITKALELTESAKKKRKSESVSPIFWLCGY
jgi:hypothetical protein